MDDSRMRVEFPLGNDLKIVVAEPTEAQAFVLMLAMKPGGGASKEETVRLTRRLFSVMEALVTQAVWDSVIESALINGHLDSKELLQFVVDVAGFPWGEQRRAAAAAPDEIPADPAPERPAPRVVHG